MINSENFNKAFYYAAENEGECSNHPMDKGGYTRCGVSLQLLKTMFKNGTFWLDKNGDGIIDQSDSDKLSTVDIKKVYYDEFWARIRSVPIDALRIKLFDAAVNVGVGRAIKMLQRSIDVIDDGIIGPKTIQKIKDIGLAKISVLFTNELEKFYIWQTFKDKSQQVFLKGWLRRANKWPDSAHEISELAKKAI